MRPEPELTPTVTRAPALESEELVKEKMFVPAVVPERMVSQPVPTLMAAEVTPVPSVTLPTFRALGLQVEPPEQAVKVGVMETPLTVLVPEAPVVTLRVGEIRRPLVVEVTAAVVASVKAKDATDPVSVPWA